MIMRYGECANGMEMSYGEEAMIDMMIDEEIWYQKNMDRLNSGIWTQKDGTKISISKMTNSHMQNCINMLKRKIANNTGNEFTELWINKFEKELEFRQYVKNIARGIFE